MKVVGETTIYAGEGSRFHPSFAQNLRGTTLKDGTLVLAANQIAPDTIFLTFEKDVPNHLFQGNPRINGEISGEDLPKQRITDGHGGWSIQ